MATALLSLLSRRQIRADWPQLKARAGWLFVVGGSGFALFNVVLYGAFARGASVVNVSMITALIPLGVLWLVSRGEPLALRRAPPVHWASLLWAMCAAATLVSVPFYAAELWTRGFHLPP